MSSTGYKKPSARPQPAGSNPQRSRPQQNSQQVGPSTSQKQKPQQQQQQQPQEKQQQQQQQNQQQNQQQQQHKTNCTCTCTCPCHCDPEALKAELLKFMKDTVTKYNKEGQAPECPHSFAHAKEGEKADLDKFQPFLGNEYEKMFAANYPKQDQRHIAEYYTLMRRLSGGGGGAGQKGGNTGNAGAAGGEVAKKGHGQRQQHQQQQQQQQRTSSGSQGQGQGQGQGKAKTGPAKSVSNPRRRDE